MVKHLRFQSWRSFSSTKKLLMVGVLVGLASVLFISQYRVGSLSSSLASTGTDGGACTQDSQCDGGSMCMNGTCQSAFACAPFVNATWSNPNDFLAGGAFDEARYPEYMQLVPLNGILSLRRQYALRITGGPGGTHAYERGVLKYFTPIREVWSGSMLVNMSKYVDPPAGYASALVLLGGYTDSKWPTGAGTWKRDFMFGAVYTQNPYSLRTFGASAYWHDSLPPWPNIGLAPRMGDDIQWPDRFIPVDWYFTPSRNLFVRVDGLPWVQIPANENAPDSLHKFRGFAAGWISSYSGGSIDIKQVKLYDSSCLVTQ